MSDRNEHRAFLNRYYGISRHFYDLTRKYFLFGRDVVVRELLAEHWDSLIEVGVGTGRNLRQLHAARPGALLGGLDASDAMLAHVRARAPWAKLQHGFAEDADLVALLGGQRPERVLFSYCLSMVTDPVAALRNTQRALAPGGKVVVVDFSDLGGLPLLLQRGLRRWLATFHVRPLDGALFTEVGATTRYGFGRYYVIAELGAAKERPFVAPDAEHPGASVPVAPGS
ncbi:MAG: class I SAM-dependent methyltransferase [Polyangiaceae bacterium]|nr:class I SAM-dependent methyltransferase [Polyangiaceae bacterium]